MIIEYVRYRVPESRRALFEEALARAAPLLASSPHCLSHELSRGVEDPERHVLRIVWDSIAGHEKGFRDSPDFERLLGEIRPFMDTVEETPHHYVPTLRIGGHPINIAVLGAGRIGLAAARQFARAGHHVALANSRGPESLRAVASELGPRVTAATAAEAVKQAELVFLGVSWPNLTEALASAGSMAGKIVIDAMNAYDTERKPVDFGDLTSSEIVARQIPGGRLVKAFNTIFWERLRDEARRKDPLAIFVASDDAEAKAVTMKLVLGTGFAPVDTGGLVDGGRLQQPGSSIYNVPLTAEEARAQLLLLRASTVP